MANPLQSFVTFFRFPDLRRKFFVVLALVLCARLLAIIPIPGVDRTQLATFFQGNSAFDLLSVFTGGGLANFSVAMMGVGPYITASIIFQLLTQVIPALETLSKDGEMGRRKIAQYTRLATIPLALIQGFSTLLFLRSSQLIAEWTPLNLTFMLLIATAGTLLLMWIGELISEQGLGNGLSLIITTGIVASFPKSLQNAWDLYANGATAQEYLQLIGFVVLAFGALMAIVFMNEAQRNIPVSYARRSRTGVQALGTVESSLPIKVNASGVVPIIFAVSVVYFPIIIARFLKEASSESVKAAAIKVESFFNNQTYYAIIYFVLVIAFTYFYAFIIFQPTQMAENLQKQGGFIPGIRPGEETAQYLTTVINRLTLAGALFIAVIAVLPNIVQQITKVGTLTLGGTSLLIAVAVVLEIMRQVRSQLITRTYDTYS